MEQLSQRANTKAGSSDPALQAEARRITDSYLTERLHSDDPTLRRKHLEKQMGRLKRLVPQAGAFVEAAEAPRRYDAERGRLRARADSGVQATLVGHVAEGIGFLRDANGESTRMPGVVPRESLQDIPRLLACATLVEQNNIPAAVRAAAQLLQDLAARPEEAVTIVTTETVRKLLARLVEQLDRCDRLYVHRHTDEVLPLVRKLVLDARAVPLDDDERLTLRAALAQPMHLPAAYDDLNTLATALRNRCSDGAPLVKLLADRRLKAAYWRAQDQEGELPASLTPSPMAKWAFTKACEAALQDFFKAQKEAYGPAYETSPMARTVRFADLYFHAELCLRALENAHLLQNQSDLQVVAMLYYFIEELSLMPETTTA